MIFTTEQLVAFDECHRKFTYSNDYEPIRMTLASALYKALAAGLKSGKPEVAESTLMQLAADPGLAMQGLHIYEIAQHHSKLLEILATYLLAQPSGKVERWKRPYTVRYDNDLLYRPQCYEDSVRLRRVVLTSTWAAERELEERNSWRTMGDIIAVGKPMLVNVLVIGALRHGYRSSFWTTAVTHPQNHQIRFQMKLNEFGIRPRFSDHWVPLRREQAGHLPTLEWLRIMQQDECFDSLVHSFEVPVPPNVEEIRSQMLTLLAEMEMERRDPKLVPRRSACYRAYAPCQFANVCPRGLSSPLQAGFMEKLVLVGAKK